MGLSLGLETPVKSRLFEGQGEAVSGHEVRGGGIVAAGFEEKHAGQLGGFS